ncbi:gliding motility-associated C-terminal domain-containing protein [Bacteroidota bacterium]
MITGAVGLMAQGIILPATPEIVRVSVDTSTGLVNINWKPSSASNVEKYALYYYIPGIDGAIAIDTVDGETRAYTYPNVVDPSISEQRLTVTAVDSNGTVSLLPEPPHRTMYLSTKFDSCEKTMDLEWTPYQGWEGKIVRNEVYYSIDGGPYIYLDKTHPDDTSYLQLNILDNKHYCYFIKAIHPETWSFSNISCRNVSHPVHPAWINAESASAIGSDQIEVKFVMDPAGEVTNFQLYKSAGKDKPFISDAIFTDVYDSLTHLDQVISTEKRFQYKLYSLDVCNNPATESNICGNIVLHVSSKGLEAFLSWNHYEEYEAGVKDYLVYRDINRSGNPVLIGGVHYPDTTYEDDLDFLSSQEIEDEICYIIEAEENESWQRGEQGFSRSNMACATVVPEILIANAIIPNAMEPNNQIKPALTFIPQQYLYQVFDRWGNRIFETTDYETAWSGRVNGGDNVPEGVYAYYIKLTTSNGIEVEKKGLITVFYK